MRFALLVAGLLWAAPLVAQRNGVKLEIQVDTNALLDGPTITTANLLADPNTREILRAGFVTRVSFRLELWRKGGVFNDLADRTDWFVYVRYDPSRNLYNVIRRQDKQLENFGDFSTVTTAEQQIGRPFHAPLRPKRAGKYYYRLAVEVEPLLESDLDALQQWLRGQNSPSKGSVVVAIRGGFGRLLSRVLGGDKQHYETRSGVFSVQ